MEIQSDLGVRYDTGAIVRSTDEILMREALPETSIGCVQEQETNFMRITTLFFVSLIFASGCDPKTDGQFPEEDIRLIIPYGAGGGFDTTARLLSPYLAEELGGEINVVPENQPGSGGRRGTTMVYRAEPDGYTLGLLNLPGLVLPSIVGEEVDYKLREMSWLGRIESQDYVLLVDESSDIHTVEELKAQDKITFTSIGYGTSVLAAIQIVSEELGLENPTFLTGYRGTSDQLVALVRGDGNATMAPVSTAEQYITSGMLRPIAVTGEGRSSHVKSVPTFAELGYPELTHLNVQRSLAAPPGVNPERLATLRDAFSRVMADPEFQAAAAKAEMDLAPLTGEEAAAQIEANFHYYEKFSANLANPNQL